MVKTVQKVLNFQRGLKYVIVPKKGTPVQNRAASHLSEAPDSMTVIEAKKATAKYNSPSCGDVLWRARCLSNTVEISPGVGLSKDSSFRPAQIKVTGWIVA
jgi:hypothetical protein